jgi:hypothetical protein
MRLAYACTTSALSAPGVGDLTDAEGQLGAPLELAHPCHARDLVLRGVVPRSRQRRRGSHR